MPLRVSKTQLMEVFLRLILQKHINIMLAVIAGLVVVNVIVAAYNAQSKKSFLN